MSGIKVGYARVSTSEQDLTAQRDGLLGLGVDEKQIYVDHGLTGTNRARPGLREAMAAVWAGDTLVVTKLAVGLTAETPAHPARCWRAHAGRTRRTLPGSTPVG